MSISTAPATAIARGVNFVLAREYVINFPKLWSRFFTAGEVRVPVAEREHAELRFTVPESFLDWLGPACLGYSTKAVALAGGRAVGVREVRRTARGGGLWEVVYDVTWRES